MFITVYVFLAITFYFSGSCLADCSKKKKKQLLVLVILPHRNELMCFLCFLSFFSFAVLHKESVLVHNRFHES